MWSFCLGRFGEAHCHKCVSDNSIDADKESVVCWTVVPSKMMQGRERLGTLLFERVNLFPIPVPTFFPLVDAHVMNSRAYCCSLAQVSEFKDQLLFAAGACSSRILEFSCGHVIPRENLLAVALARGSSGQELDFTYQSRERTDMVRKRQCAVSLKFPIGKKIACVSFQSLVARVGTLPPEFARICAPIKKSSLSTHTALHPTTSQGTASLTFLFGFNTRRTSHRSNVLNSHWVRVICVECSRGDR